MTAAGVVVGAGCGSRLGVDQPKALVEVEGRALVAHAVERLAAAGVHHLVVVHPPGAGPSFDAACGGLPVAALVPGGDTRTASVLAGVEVLSDEVGVVAVHDAARGLCPVDTIRRALAALGSGVVAAAPALPVADTLKRVVDDRVVETLDRRGVVAVQTPQVIRRDVLELALALRDDGATDDLGLVEAAIARGEVAGRVVVVAGAVLARKVTYPSDLTVVRALAAHAEAAP